MYNYYKRMFPINNRARNATHISQIRKCIEETNEVLEAYKEALVGLTSWERVVEEAFDNICALEGFIDAVCRTTGVHKSEVYDLVIEKNHERGDW